MTFSRRRLLQDGDETDYQVDIIIIDATDTINNANVTPDDALAWFWILLIILIFLCCFCCELYDTLADTNHRRNISMQIEDETARIATHGLDTTIGDGYQGESQEIEIVGQTQGVAKDAPPAPQPQALHPIAINE